MVHLVELYYLPVKYIDFDRYDLAKGCGKQTIFHRGTGNVVWANHTREETPLDVLHRYTSIPFDYLAPLCDGRETVEEVIENLPVSLDNQTYLSLRYYKSGTLDNFPLRNILSSLSPVKSKECRVRATEVVYGRETKIYIASTSELVLYVALEEYMTSHGVLELQNIVERKVEDSTVLLEAYLFLYGNFFLVKFFVVSPVKHPLSQLEFFKPESYDLAANALDRMSEGEIITALGYSSPKNRHDLMKLLSENGP